MKPANKRTKHRIDAWDDRRTAVLDRWKSLTLDVYPERAAQFMGREPDQFRNPVGHVVDESLERLFDGLVDGVPVTDLQMALDGIVRIRAVQDLPPSAAVGFVFLLKRAILEELRERGGASVDEDDRKELFERIDDLALGAFDRFMECREQIHALRVREIRGRTPRTFVSLRERKIAGADPAEDDSDGSSTRGGCAG